MSLSTEAHKYLKKHYNYSKKDIQVIDNKNNVFLHIQSGTVIKIMSKEHNNEKMINIFPLLQRINEQFKNPQNIASFKDRPVLLKDNTMMFLIQDYGISMDKQLENQKDPLDCKEVLEIAIQMAKGLAILQIGGVNHRDVKPSNFIKVGNVIKVIDFDISKTKLQKKQNSIQATTTSTFNQGTRQYFSPKRMENAHYQPDQPCSVGFLDDSYSLGLVILEMIVKKTMFQSQFTKFKTVQAPRYSKKLYQVPQILEKLKSEMDKKASSYQGIHLLLSNLLSFKQQERIDLMATYKFLYNLRNQKKWDLQQMKAFLNNEITLSQQRIKKNASRAHEEKYYYISLAPSGIKISRTTPIMVCASYDNDALIIYNSTNKEYKKEYFQQRLQDGFGIALTNDDAYIMGGEDDKTGKCLDTNLRCNLKVTDINEAARIIDDGRNLLAVSYNFNGNFIALSGGYKVHSKVAKNILVFHPREQKWIKGPQLKYSKINASACFTDTCFFTFGGFSGEYSQDVKDQRKIQYFLSDDIKSGRGQCYQLALRGSVDDSMSSYLTAAAGLAIHMKGENILLLGGLGDKFEEDYADGYVLKINGEQNIDDEQEYKAGDARMGEMIKIKEEMGITRSTFYSPAIFYQNSVFISFPDSNDKGAKFLEGKYENYVLSFEEHWLNSLDN